MVWAITSYWRRSAQFTIEFARGRQSVKIRKIGHTGSIRGLRTPRYISATRYSCTSLETSRNALSYFEFWLVKNVSTSRITSFNLLRRKMRKWAQKFRSPKFLVGREPGWVAWLYMRATMNFDPHIQLELSGPSPELITSLWIFCQKLSKNWVTFGGRFQGNLLKFWNVYPRIWIRI